MKSPTTHYDILYEMGGWGDSVIFQLTFLNYKSLPFIDALF